MSTSAWTTRQRSSLGSEPQALENSFTYTPQANFAGADSFTYQARDADSDTAAATVTLTVAAVQDPIAPVRLSNVAAGIGGFRIIGESAGDNAGTLVSGAGDANGDGLDDLLVGAHLNAAGGTNAGAAYVVFGRAGGAEVNLDDLAAGTSTAGFKIVGETGGDLAGTSVSAAGDVNGDGLDDLLVGADRNDAGGQDAGAAYVLYGSTDWLV